MIAIPAIDLRAGACVQLVGGSYDDERVRETDPLAVAQRFCAAGFERVHVVDLDAATGRGSNAGTVRRLLDQSDGGVQVGGGVRTAAGIDRLLAANASAVVVGTRAVEEPDWLAREARRNPQRLILAADVRGNRIVTSGWAHETAMTVDDLLGRTRDVPLAGILITSVDREGRLDGPDLPLYERLRSITTTSLIASGGVSSMQDLHDLKNAGADAVVIGMALYTDRLRASEVAEGFSTCR